MDAYLLDHDRKETGDVGQNPDQTRGGMAFKFKEDLYSTYAGHFNIELKNLNFDVHYPGKVIEGKKRKERQAIFAALAANFNVRIINRAEDREGSKREIKSGHIDQLHRLTQFKSNEIDINTGEEKEIKGGLRFLTEEMQGPNNKPELVLLVTDKTEYYNETRVDPYPIFKRNHDGVSQNVCYFNRV